MNILVINGSPRGEKSNTFKLTAAFLDGLRMKGNHQIDVVTITDMKIEPCKGCYACWTKSPGRCIIKDDMAKLIEKYINADLLVWSFPLYYFGVPSQTKAFMDRLLPLNLPEITIRDDGRSGHPPRYDLSGQRAVLISSCGFYSVKNNYDALVRQFEILYGERLAKIICPESELFGIPQLAARTGEYLSYVKTAGQEYASFGKFSDDTQNKLGELLYPPEVFVEMANASWDIQEAKPEKATGATCDASYRFMRQMAALYNPQVYEKDIVLEMYFTDIDKAYQLMLGNEKCELKTDNFLSYTTRIETSFEVWLKISGGEISGSEAMIKRQYKVLGDFNTMLKMDDFFGTSQPAKHSDEAGDTRKSSNMMLLLLPFMAMWILFPINATIGGAAAVLVSGLIPILHFFWRPTPYERISAFAAAFVGVFAMLFSDYVPLLSVPSFVFGAIWLTSAFFEIPLTAYYSCKEYGGKKAFENPLFIRTNRILTAMWGVTHFIMGALGLFIADTILAPYWGIISNVPTLLLGMFTVWFVKWYPAKVARG